MATRRIFEDADFGKIIVGSRRGARNISMRAKADGLYVTVPPFTKFSAVAEAVERFRPQLLEAYRKVKPEGITGDFAIDAPCFKLKLKEGLKNNFTLHFTDNGEVELLYPRDTDFSRKEVQQLIRAGIVRAMKRNAAILLPPVLEMFAKKYGLKYRKVKITGARKRWGSCSSAGSISLSCYLLLLPPHLSDYVLLHELAHTVEMNHGPGFWRQLDSMTEGQALQLRKELREYKPDF